MQPSGPLTKLVKACDELGQELGMPDWNIAYITDSLGKERVETLGDDESVVAYIKQGLQVTGLRR